jgi:hypothetical protein
LNIQIKVVAVEIGNSITKTGKPYKVAEVTYKDLGMGKTATKKIMPFNHKEVFHTLETAEPGSAWLVGTEKNGEFREWTSIKPLEGGEANATPTSTGSTKAAGSPAPSRGDWETREERAKRQVYIIKQSSITAAIALLKTDKKNPDVSEVIKLAQELTNWVLTDIYEQPPAAAKPMSLEDFENDLPS